MGGLAEPSPWLQAFLILFLASLTILLAEKLGGYPLFREEFKYFILYGPAGLSLAIYFFLRLKGKERESET